MTNIDHLGGFSQQEEIGDAATYHPNLWQYMIDTFKIKSLLDVGCGMGISTKFFYDRGCKIQGIEGHPTCKEKSKVKDYIKLHDYTYGESEVQGVFDMCWSCEFVEHVEEKYSNNFLKDFSKAKIVLITHAVPGQGGWHHVNCQHADYWISKMAEHGLIYNEEMTDTTKQIAEKDWKMYSPSYKSHYADKGLVFLNKNYAYNNIE